MQRWSLDFVSDQLVDCRRFRVLNTVDDHSRFCPGIPGVPVEDSFRAIRTRKRLPLMVEDRKGGALLYHRAQSTFLQRRCGYLKLGAAAF